MGLKGLLLFNNQKVIALIPARGGSKGLPRKNLARIGGRTLIELAIDSAINCSSVDEIFLSTDDAEIEDLGKNLGVKIHQRSSLNSQDTSTASDLVAEFISSLDLSRDEPNAILTYLQPTSPLRTAHHLNNAFEILAAGNSYLCVSVTEDRQTAFKSVLIDESGRVVPLFDNQFLSQNRQAVPKTYHPNGAVYIFPIHHFLESGSFPIEGSIPLMMSMEDSVDIDNYDDLQLAQGIWDRNHG